MRRDNEDNTLQEVKLSRLSHWLFAALELAKKISLAMKNCPRDMPVDSIMSESPQ